MQKENTRISKTFLKNKKMMINKSVIGTKTDEQSEKNKKPRSRPIKTQTFNL